MSGQGENQKWGYYAEWTARIAYSLTRERSWYHDARDDSGEPVEIKACVRRTARDRRGAYWIERAAHEELRANDGWYVFAVYDPAAWSVGPVLELEMKRAEWLDDVDPYGWTSTNGHHKGDEVIKPTWTAVFDSDVVADGVSVATE